MSRYERPCPACGAIIRARDIHLTGDSFPCPACGEWLTINHPLVVIWPASLVVAIILTWHWVRQDILYLLVTECITLVLGLLGIFLDGAIHVPGFKRLQQGKGKSFDDALSLHLADRPGGDKKTNP